MKVMYIILAFHERKNGERITKFTSVLGVFNPLELIVCTMN